MYTPPRLDNSSTSEACVGSISCCRPDGGLTAMPAADGLGLSTQRSAWTAIAPSMKITTITRNTSVSGVMLMSAKIGSLSVSASSSGTVAIAMVTTTWRPRFGLHRVLADRRWLRRRWSGAAYVQQGCRWRMTQIDYRGAFAKNRCMTEVAVKQKVREYIV